MRDPTTTTRPPTTTRTAPAGTAPAARRRRGRLRGPAFAAAALLCAVPACFVQPRETEDIFDDLPLGTGEPCNSDAACDDGNACTVDRCVSNGGYSGMCTSSPITGTPDDHNPCTEDLCEGGQPVHQALAAGAPCGDGGQLQCDGDGTCVGCGTSGSACGATTECLSWACKDDACVRLPAVEGLVLDEQVEGDCAVIVCDGEGGTKGALDANDHMPIDGMPCMVQICNGAYQQPRPEGTPCGTTCAWLGSGIGTQPMACTFSGICQVQSGSAVTLCTDGDGCSEGKCRDGCALDVECGPGSCESGSCVP